MRFLSVWTLRPLSVGTALLVLYASVCMTSSAMGLLAGIPPAVPEGSWVSWNLNAGFDWASWRRLFCLFWYWWAKKQTQKTPVSKPAVMTIDKVVKNQLTNSCTFLSASCSSSTVTFGVLLGSVLESAFWSLFSSKKVFYSAIMSMISARSLS